MRLASLSSSRPDCPFEISKITQVMKNIFDEESREIIRRVNNLVSFAVENKVLLKFPKLDLKRLKIVGFSDAFFAGNRDSTSELGYSIFLCDGSHQAAPLVLK